MFALELGQIVVEAKLLSRGYHIQVTLVDCILELVDNLTDLRVSTSQVENLLLAVFVYQGRKGANEQAECLPSACGAFDEGILFALDGLLNSPHDGDLLGVGLKGKENVGELRHEVITARLLKIDLNL